MPPFKSLLPCTLSYRAEFAAKILRKAHLNRSKEISIKPINKNLNIVS